VARRGARRDLQRDAGHYRYRRDGGGRVLDRRGPRPVFLLAGTAGAGAMLLASVQGALLPFAVAYARAAPAAPARAIIWLTLFGALSSPVYLPLTAWLTQAAGWRSAIRVEAGTVAVAFVLAAVLISDPGRSQPGQPAARPGCSGPPGGARWSGRGWPPPCLAGPR
jgi:hypothetical protein